MAPSPVRHPALRLERNETREHAMRIRLMMLTFIATLALARGQNPPVPGAVEGPGVSGDAERTPRASYPGPGKRNPQDRRFRPPAHQGAPGGPGEQFEADGRGPMQEMGPEAGWPGFDGGPEFAFERGSGPDAMAGPEGLDAGPDGFPSEGMDGDQEFGTGPAFGEAPGMVRGPGSFGPRPGRPAFGMMAPPPGEALQALLDLTDDQVRSLRRLQRERAVRLDEARLQLHQKQDNLLDLLEQEEPDGSALVSTVKSIHALRRQAREAEKEFQEKTSAILNEDQKTRWKSLQEAHQIPRAMREAARFDLVRPMEMGPGKPVPQR